MSGFTVDPDALRDQAREVEATASTVQEIHSATGNATSLSPQAFGILCSFFTPPTLLMSTTARTAITEIRTALDAHGPALNATARDFEAVDAGVGRRFDAMRGDL